MVFSIHKWKFISHSSLLSKLSYFDVLNTQVSLFDPQIISIQNKAGFLNILAFCLYSLLHILILFCRFLNKCIKTMFVSVSVSSYSQDKGSLHPRCPLCLRPDVVQQLPGQPVLPVGEPPPQTSSFLLSPGPLLARLSLTQAVVQHCFSSLVVVTSLRFNYTSGFWAIVSRQMLKV